MFPLYVSVTALAAAATIGFAVLDLTRSRWVIANMTKVHVPQSWLIPLGALKAAGALGLLVGIGIPLIGAAAALGLTLFFLGAIATHLRAHEYSLHYPGVFLVLAVASLALRFAA
jgi:hypothetical protein